MTAVRDLACLAVLSLVTGPAAHHPPPAAADEDLVTLWAQDDLRATFDFAGGASGAKIVGGELILDDCQLAFHLFAENQVAVGFVRQSAAAILDLGDLRVAGVKASSDRAPKPALSVFHTLRRDGSRIVYDGALGKTQRLHEAERVLSATPAEGLRTFIPEVGHTWLMVFRPEGLRGREEIVVKLLVVDVQAGRSLTFRWSRI